MTITALSPRLLTPTTPGYPGPPSPKVPGTPVTPRTPRVLFGFEVLHDQEEDATTPIAAAQASLDDPAAGTVIPSIDDKVFLNKDDICASDELSDTASCVALSFGEADDDTDNETATEETCAGVPSINTQEPRSQRSSLLLSDPEDSQSGPVAVKVIPVRTMRPIKTKTQGPFTPSAIRRPSVLPGACIFVGNLSIFHPLEQVHAAVVSIFQQFGPMVHHKADKDRNGKPFVFIQFEHVADARRALQEGPGTVIMNRECRVEYANVNRTLQLSNIPRTHTYNHIAKIIERYGPCEEISVEYDFPCEMRPDGAPMFNAGRCVATFFSREDAIVAFKDLQRERNWDAEFAPRAAREVPGIDYEPCAIAIGRINGSIVNNDILMEKFSRYGTIRHFLIETPSRVPRSMSLAGHSNAYVYFDNAHSAQLAIDEENGNVWLNQVISVKHLRHQQGNEPHQPAPQPHPAVVHRYGEIPLTLPCPQMPIHIIPMASHMLPMPVPFPGQIFPIVHENYPLPVHYLAPINYMPVIF